MVQVPNVKMLRGPQGCILFVKCPHAYYLDGLNVVKDLIDKAVLNIYPSREGSGEITHQFLIGWRVLVWIVLKHF